MSYEITPDVACPVCGAQPGEPCNFSPDDERESPPWFHTDRSAPPERLGNGR